MASNYWIKLYHEILDDAKMGKLPDHLWRRTVELFLIAGDNHKDGMLPSLQQMAWRLRTSDELLQSELDELVRLDILSIDDDVLTVTNFEKRQSPMDGAERMARFRAKKLKDDYHSDDVVTDTVTNRHTEEKRIDKDKIQITSTIFNELKTEWKRLLPKKPQPRKLGDKNRAHLKARIKDDFFIENWLVAMTKASKSMFLNENGFFTLWWFIENDDNWQKCFDGNYDDKGAGAGLQAFAAR